jgi:hypothetical protein
MQEQRSWIEMADLLMEKSLSEQIQADEETWKHWAQSTEDASSPPPLTLTARDAKFITPILYKIFAPTQLLPWLQQQASKDLLITPSVVPSIAQVVDTLLQTIQQRSVILVEDPRFQSSLYQLVAEEAVKRNLIEEKKVLVVHAENAAWTMVESALTQLEEQGGWLVLSSLSPSLPIIARLASWLQTSAQVPSNTRLFLQFSRSIASPSLEFDDRIQGRLAMSYLQQSSFLLRSTEPTRWTSLAAEAMSLLGLDV